MRKKEDKIRVSTNIDKDVARFIKVQAAKEDKTQAEIIEKSVKLAYKDLEIK